MISPCEILQNDESKIRILRDSVKDDKNPKHTNQLESFVIKNFQSEIFCQIILSTHLNPNKITEWNLNVTLSART